MKQTRQSSRQHGVVLLVALIMLIAITLAGLSLFRQVSTATLIAGNLAFKQGATSAADRGVEDARSWLISTATTSLATLQGTNKLTNPAFYFPAWCYTSTGDWGTAGTNSDCNRATPTPPAFDPLTYDWSAATKSQLATGPDTDANGWDSRNNRVRYVVHRLCSMDGAINAVREYGPAQAIQSCALAASGVECLDKGVLGGENCLSQSVQPYYRVTARVEGPRNTVSFVEVILY